MKAFCLLTYNTQQGICSFCRKSHFKIVLTSLENSFEWNYKLNSWRS